MNSTLIFKEKRTVKTFHKEFLADMDTPVSSYFKLHNGERSFLLESMAGNGSNSRYSILGFKPMVTFLRTSNTTTIEDHTNGEIVELTGNPYDHLRQLIASFEFDRDALFE